MRIDKALWFLRLAGTRALAQQWVLAGHIRLNGRRVTKPATALKAGDVLTLPRPGGVLVIVLNTLPARRGPASEAQACYRVLDERGANLIAAEQMASAEGKLSP